MFKNIAYFKILTFILIGFLFSQCRTKSKLVTPVPSESKVVDTALPDWAKNSTIYEVNVRQYTEEGTFKAFQSHLPRLKGMGVKILWFMPIYPISETKRKGTLGSYYAVNDFTKVNSEFGTMEDFENLIKDIHRLDMHIILDWVPNHTGWDHAWLKKNKDWYTQNENGQVIDPSNPETGESWGWSDVADLNYDNPDLRKAMIADMKFWIETKNIDGFRMDVAHNVPDDFWLEVKQEVFSLGKPIFMLAEAEHPMHRNSESFHMSYGWSFHHLMNQIAKGEKSASDIDTWLEEDRSKFQKGMHMHFTTNHDENTWNGTVFERMKESHLTLAALSFLLEGMPLIYSGQEEPLRKRLEFFEKDNIDFKNYEYEEFYSNLINLKTENEALWNGSYGGPLIKLFDDKNIFAFERQKNDSKIIALFNLSKRQAKADLPIQISGQLYSNGENLILEKGIELELEPWEYLIFIK